MSKEADDPARPLRETETVSPRFVHLETWSRRDILSALLDGQTQALHAVAAAVPVLERAVAAALARLERPGSRLVYVGAGTSGRLAVLDAVELHPTFNWPQERTVLILAGGEAGLTRAQEGAEDDAAAACLAVESAFVGQDDVVLGLAASGSTPFTLSAIETARRRGALTLGLANNPDAALLHSAEIGILLRTGAEVLAGSTRLAAGTSQKIALNLFSTTLMIGLGKVRSGRMVDMRVSNAKLRWRARAMLADITACSQEEAERVLESADYDLKAALQILEGRGGGAARGEGA